MREIKFRAWFTGTKSMQDWAGISHRFSHETGYWYFNNPKIILMQYTGLKDKNGVELYQGDIINVFNWGASNNELLGITSVIWDEDECGWRYGNSSELLSEDFYDQFRNVEKIGNIYENPELLKGKGSNGLLV